MTVTKIPIMTCRVCGNQFARSRRIILRGKEIVRFETRAKFCSNACRQKYYRNKHILKRRESVTKFTGLVTIA